MQPVIGITCHITSEKGKKNYLVDTVYAERIEEGGGIPFMLPITKRENIKNLLTKIGGLLLTGGAGSLDPKYFDREFLPSLKKLNPVRYEFEKQLIEFAFSHRMPCIGICRGCQMINEVAGGSIIPLNIGSAKNGRIEHFQKLPAEKPTHKISLSGNSILRQLIGSDSIKVNSFHRQSIKEIAPSFKISARAEDGTIEAIESKEGFILGLQFYPLKLKNKKFTKLFEAFVKEASKFRGRNKNVR